MWVHFYKSPMNTHAAIKPTQLPGLIYRLSQASEEMLGGEPGNEARNIHTGCGY